MEICKMNSSINIAISEAKIFLIRGKHVMLDKDLASIYGVPTKRLSEQVKRNQQRFPQHFMFQLTNGEWIELRSQNATLNISENPSGGRGTHSKYLPHVFTEHGVSMLSAVLKSPLAIQVSIQIIEALQRLEEIFDAKKNTAQGDELELLSLLIEQFRMEQMGCKQKDLAEIIGLKSRVSEILNRKRKLTLEMIRKLHDAMGIPTEVLVREY
jgi:predicted XRE-type DNA-binding protein